MGNARVPDRFANSKKWNVTFPRLSRAIPIWIWPRQRRNSLVESHRAGGKRWRGGRPGGGQGATRGGKLARRVLVVGRAESAARQKSRGPRTRGRVPPPPRSLRQVVSLICAFGVLRGAPPLHRTVSSPATFRAAPSRSREKPANAEAAPAPDRADGQGVRHPLRDTFGASAGVALCPSRGVRRLKVAQFARGGRAPPARSRDTRAAASPHSTSRSPRSARSPGQSAHGPPPGALARAALARVWTSSRSLDLRCVYGPQRSGAERLAEGDGDAPGAGQVRPAEALVGEGAGRVAAGGRGTVGRGGGGR